MWAKSGRIWRTAAASMLLALGSGVARADVARGEYLVRVIGCSDCHTPGGFTPKPDMTRYMAGSDAAFDVPGMGAFTPPNLTPDEETGLGRWTMMQIVTAITKGVRPDGRVLATPMPWSDFSHLSRSDALSIAAYLKSLPAIAHKTPPPAASRILTAGVEETVVRNPR